MSTEHANNLSTNASAFLLIPKVTIHNMANLENDGMKEASVVIDEMIDEKIENSNTQEDFLKIVKLSIIKDKIKRFLNEN